jgi:hypothetical protein
MSGEFNKHIEILYKELKEKLIFTKKQLEFIIDATGYNATLKNFES